LVPFIPFAVGDIVNLKIGLLDPLSPKNKQKADKSLEINDSEMQGYLDS
jgi:hypothetical protein